ncbi:MAG: hypothetical protein QNJ47_22375 [Nostocaceae cyanobacterium]|nr:hypothetical protein [Nostocaceae cyanobacterium]
MNLPVILDVALGLIFIYLILSLLASEIQELIATVLQWRAQHLRKSIEIFLGGGVQNSEDAKVIDLANRIYSNPLISSLNQEAKGFLATLPRKCTWAIASLSRSFKKEKPGIQAKDTIFGNQKHSAPSYIPASAFAMTLMDSLQLPMLLQTLTDSRLEKFKSQRLGEIEKILLKLQEQVNYDDNFAIFFNYAYQSFAEMQADFEQIIYNFKQNKANLHTSLNRMAESIDRYIANFEAEMPNNELAVKALKHLQFLRRNMFDDIQKTISTGGLQPNISEVVQIINKGSSVYEEIKTALQDDSEAFQNLEKVMGNLPPSIVEKINLFAKTARTRIQKTESGVNLLRLEIESSFNNSMERASGVYKRNAKGVAILIGCLIATSANADTFHIVSRLSKDSALRETIVNNAGEIIRQNPDFANLEALKNQTDGILTNISLPIGWNNVNLEQQIAWTPQKQQSFPIFKALSVFMGWIISGIAIAMGAPFWFDLLNKIVNVRNSGKIPSSSRNSSDDRAVG